MRVTIKDVAAEAGVSFQVVSAILNNCSYARASKETRQRVTDAARKLNYVPNISARILQGGSSRMTGVLVDSRASENVLRVLAALEKCAVVRGCRLLISEAHDDPQRLWEGCRELQQYGVDGIIALAHSYPGIGSLLDSLAGDSKVIPVLDADPGNYSAVVTDTAEGFALAVRHLLAEGYRTPVLVMLGPARHQSMKERVRGFFRVLPGGRVLTLPEDCTDPAADRRQEGIAAAVAELRETGADAAVCSNDYLAALLSRELRKSGVRIPEDFGITGYDNLRFCSSLDVELTSVEPDFTEVAESTFRLLERKIAGSEENCYVAVPPRLVVRASSMRNQLFSNNPK